MADRGAKFMTSTAAKAAVIAATVLDNGAKRIDPARQTGARVRIMPVRLV